MPSAAAVQRAKELLRRLEECGGSSYAELGVLGGDMARSVLLMNQIVIATLVDSWSPPERKSEAYRKTRDEAAFTSAARNEALFNRVMAMAKQFPGRAHVVRATTDDAAKTLCRSSFDAVFIDADHSYEGCRNDILNWAGFVKPGGWLGGHDYRNPDPRFDFSGVERAVHEWLEESAPPGSTLDLGDNFTWWVRL